MLRQYAFIFLLFLLPFYALFGCPSGQDDIKSAQDNVQSEQGDVKSAQGDVQQSELPEGAVRRFGSGNVGEVVYSPDGQYLAAAAPVPALISGPVAIYIYDAHNLLSVPVKLLTGHTDRVSRVSFSPHGNTIASASWDAPVRLWDVNTGKNIKTFTGHIGSVSSVRFSPDGRTIASGSLEGTVLLWDVSGLGMRD